MSVMLQHSCLLLHTIHICVVARTPFIHVCVVARTPFMSVMLHTIHGYVAARTPSMSVTLHAIRPCAQHPLHSAPLSILSNAYP